MHGTNPNVLLEHLGANLIFAKKMLSSMPKALPTIFRALDNQ